METRRRFLERLAIGVGVVASQSALGQPAEGAAYVGVETSATTGLSRASFFGLDGERVGSAPLCFRAHGFAKTEDTIIVFPRRPGNRFGVVDLLTFEVRSSVIAPVDRHFCGHGAFTTDGRCLVVTENDLNTLQGGIGIYETGNPMRRLGEIPLPGPGPHEIIRAHDKDQFFIALGGLETHPDYGRTPLNLSTFRSQVLRFDFARMDVEPLGDWPGTEGVSLRHLAQDDGGRLYVGGQIADPRRARSTDVLWLLEGDRALRLPDDQRLGGYVSSVAARGHKALVTSKEAATVLTLDRARIVGTLSLDGASAAAIGDGLQAVSGYTSLELNGKFSFPTPAHEFDNHGLSLA